MNHASHDHRHLYGCAGDCQQGRRPCDCRDELANGATTMPAGLEDAPERLCSGLGLGMVIALTVFTVICCVAVVFA